MIQLDTAVGAAGAVALSAAVFVSVRRARRSRLDGLVEFRHREPPGLPSGLALRPVEIVPAQRAETAPPLLLLDPIPAAIPAAAPATPEAARPTVRVRRVEPAGRVRTPRPAAPLVLGASPSLLAEVHKAELLSLIGTMQWDRALACIQQHAAQGCDLAALAAVAEAPALERVRALPESEARVGLGGYRVLATLVPSSEAYAAKVAELQAALEGRRTALLARLTRDEDRFEPGTVWFNHPYNAAFDDVRLPIWLYVGRKDDGQPWLRLRTNWLGDTRISVQGIEVIHDGMSETLTRGAYKIDADALGWEWRDEVASVYQVEVLRSLMGAKDVTLRYKGDPYTCEVDLTEDEKHAVAEMMELYDLMRLAAASPRAALAA